MPRLNRTPADPTSPVSPPIPVGVTNTEPVALAGAVQGLLSALLAVVVGFGVWDPTPEQIGMLMALHTAIITAGTAFARGKVSSPATVARIRAGEQ